MIFMAPNPKNKIFINGEWVDSSSDEHVYFDLTGLARNSWHYQVYGKK